MRYNNKPQNNSTAIIIGAISVAVLTIIMLLVFLSCSKNGENSVGSQEKASSQITQNYSSSSVTDLSSDNSSDEVSSKITSEITIGNGVWNRTKVKKDSASVLSISDGNSEGFSFTVNSSKGDAIGKVSGRAKYISSGAAECNVDGTAIIFTLQENYVVITHSGDETKLGCKEGVTHDGTYVKGDPEYIDKLTESSYSADIRKSTMCKSALKGCMTGNDYEKMNSIIESGTLLLSRGDELSYDKNGVEINVDSELKGVKYTYSLKGTGEYALLICTNGGKVYSAIVSEGEMRYYTNDATYAGDAPKSFENAAKNFGVKLRYMSK